jgi:hypothetical protein
MDDDAYRGDFAAAQARIAQLEAELEAARGAGSPDVLALEAQHAKLVESAPKRTRLAWMLLGVAGLIGLAPMVWVELAYEGVAAAAWTLGGALILFVALGFVFRWAGKKSIEQAVALSAKKVEEARRLQRLEQQVAALTTERAAGPRVELRQDSPAETAIEETVDADLAPGSRSGARRAR